MKDIEELELAIIEFEKELEEDYNNEWLKRVIAGMKSCKQRLEEIDNKITVEDLAKEYDIKPYEIREAIIFYKVKHNDNAELKRLEEIENLHKEIRTNTTSIAKEAYIKANMPRYIGRFKMKSKLKGSQYHKKNIIF